MAPTAQTAGLNLVVRHVLAGLGHGLHAGRERGTGVEFSEYRAYAPGDEWRRVDWKLLARTDRAHVREAERDSHVAVWLLLDASASMAEPSRDPTRAGLTKLRFACTLLACIAAVAQRQGDAFGLLQVGNGRVAATSAARGPRQLHRVLAQLVRAQPQGAGADAALLRTALSFARAPSLVFAVSDGLDWPSPWSDALLRLRRMRHDVRLLCLQTQAEAAAALPPGSAWRDAEAPAGLHRSDAGTRAAYAAALAAHFDTVRAQCRQHDLPLQLATIEQPVAAVLRAWLRQAAAR